VPYSNADFKYQLLSVSPFFGGFGFEAETDIDGLA